MQATVCHEVELEGGFLWHIQQVQFVMQECRQIMIELLCVADYSGGSIAHLLQLICDHLWRACIDSIAVVSVCHHESMHKNCCLFCLLMI